MQEGAEHLSKYIVESNVQDDLDADPVYNDYGDNALNEEQKGDMDDMNLSDPVATAQVDAQNPPPILMDAFDMTFKKHPAAEGGAIADMTEPSA